MQFKCAYYPKRPTDSFGSMKDPRELEQLCSKLLTKSPKPTLGKGQSLEQTVLGKVDIHMQKMET